METKRLDAVLVDRGLVSGRERAKELIQSGRVRVEGRRVMKPAAQVEPGAVIQCETDGTPYVGRGGLKLEKALRVFRISPAGWVCGDCGASTGGFTDVLLQNGAAKVYAMDVGYGQLAWSLRTDPRVVCLERTNVRYVTRAQVPEELDLATADLSFISLRLVLGAIYGLLKDHGQAVCLVKPQFEAGRENVGKKGVVRDPAVHRQVLEEFLAYSAAGGFFPAGPGFFPHPRAGGEH